MESAPLDSSRPRIEHPRPRKLGTRLNERFAYRGFTFPLPVTSIALPFYGMTDLEILAALDAAVAQPAIARHVDLVVPTLEAQLERDPGAIMAWEPIPLDTYRSLPPEIRSSWIFVLRKGTTTGAERHPNSHQRMMSYRGGADFPEIHDDKWVSLPLTSDRSRPIAERWATIPPYTWHQGIVDADQHWVVVSFHTVPAEELIEERPTDSGGVDGKLYLEPGAKLEVSFRARLSFRAKPKAPSLSFRAEPRSGAVEESQFSR